MYFKATTIRELYSYFVLYVVYLYFIHLRLCLDLRFWRCA